MDNISVPRIAKWPFLSGDLFLLGFAGLVIYLSPQPIDPWLVLASGLAVLTGAWLGVTPFLLQYRAQVEQARTEAVASSLDLLQNLEKVDGHIGHATAQWQNVQELAGQTTREAKDIADRMAAEAKAFSEFLRKANESEKNHLRLEVEKLKRAEGEWLQVTIGMLDHIFALFQAAVRSAQPTLIEQLGQFQRACRDVARRMGLVPFVPEENTPFDAKVHQPVHGNGELPASTRIRNTLAAGYTYQGQFLRRALVEIHPDSLSTETASNPLPAEAPRATPSDSAIGLDPTWTSTAETEPAAQSDEPPAFGESSNRLSIP